MTKGMFQRLQKDEVLSWLNRQGVPAETLTELSGDVSMRRYTRVGNGGETSILATYPPEMEPACRNFLESTRLLSQAQVRVPQVLSSDCEMGLMLLEDVGTDSVYDLRELSPSGLAAYFWRATADLPRIQSISTTEVAPLNPPLGRDLLRQELDQTWSTLFNPQGVVTDPGFAHCLQDVLDQLCALLAEEIPVPCHRDFMVRNLIPVDPTPELAVLDHQDLRMGPRYYDLASLLNDSLFPVPDLEEKILLQSLGEDPLERIRYHRAAAQRTLKATGTYEKFAQRGFERHRRLIPGTLQRALRHLRFLPEARYIHSELEKRIAPLLIC